jgi:hypothetical protein
MQSQGLTEARDIKALGLKALKAKTSAERMEALLAIRRYDHPIVLDVLARAQQDQDAGVRDLAKNLHRRKQLDWEANPPQRPTATPQSSKPAAKATVAGDWNCRFCGGDNTSQAAACVHCGANRSGTEHTTSQTPTLESIFLLDRQNKPLLLGKPRRGAAAFGLFPVLVLAGMLLIGSIFIVVTIREFYRYTMLTSGLVTSGEVTDRDLYVTDGVSSYVLDVRYQVADAGYTLRENVSESVYERTEIGSRIEILYAPADPALAKVNGTNDPPWLWGVFVVCWNGLILTIFVSVLAHRNRVSRLLRKGHLIYGEVIRATSTLDSDNDVQVTVEYGFAAPGTRDWLTGKQTATRNDLRDLLPERGTPVAILYLDAQTHMLC